MNTILTGVLFFSGLALTVTVILHIAAQKTASGQKNTGRPAGTNKISLDDDFPDYRPRVQNKTQKRKKSPSRKRFSLSGSLHFNSLVSDIPLLETGLPEYVYIPLKLPHINALPRLTVKKGDKVRVGSLLSQNKKYPEADIYASVSGKITGIENISDAFGAEIPAVIIKVEKDDFEPSIDLSPDIIREIPYSEKEIISKIRHSGIFSLAGAESMENVFTGGQKISRLIINGIDAEPFPGIRENLLCKKAEQIIIGAKILNKAFGIQNALIAINRKRPDILKLVSGLTRRYVGVNTRSCPAYYPSGQKNLLITAITGREISAGRRPENYGFMVLNAEVALAVYEAVMKNKPLCEHFITINEKGKSTSFCTRLGTPVDFLLKKLSLSPENGKIILGNVLTGREVLNSKAPLTGQDSKILYLVPSEQISGPCIRCGKCLEACPLHLQPYAIASALQSHDQDRLKQLHAADCIECGACAFVCPARIPLLSLCRQSKTEFKNN